MKSLSKNTAVFSQKLYCSYGIWSYDSERDQKEEKDNKENNKSCIESEKIIGKHRQTEEYQPEK
jgi:hypothetical protein